MTDHFKQYNFQPFIYEALDAIDFYEPTAIQAKVIPEMTKNRDLVVQSQTGSGKTHAFLLPLINQIEADKREVQVVITAPSRELAEQLYRMAEQVAGFADPEIIVGRFIGGRDKEKSLDKLEHHQPHIAIGTPGRMLDMIHSNALDIHKAPFMVVDEADMTLDMGFLNVVDQIASRIPKESQLFVFSATIPEKLQPFFRKYMNNPKFIESESQSLLSESVDNWLISTRSKNRIDLIHEVLTLGQPYLALIFANTKEKVDEIAKQLVARGLNCCVLHGGLSARERRRVMRQIRNLEYQYVVATDLASRGIDIDGVSHVVNAEIPRELDFFIHRVGRTGRNNLPGTAITFYHPDESPAIDILEDKGIEFQPKTIKNGRVVDVKDRRNRQQRKHRQQKTYDPEIAGMVKKAKKKIKPGYKKKINEFKKRKARRQRRKKK